MPVEIGSLVVNGTFVSDASDDITVKKLRDAVARLQRDMREEIKDMIAEAERRREDR